MNVRIEWAGLTLEANCYYEPYIPSNTHGHPDNWTGPSGGCAEIESLECDGRDARFLLRSPEIRSDLEELAYEACERELRCEA